MGGIEHLPCSHLVPSDPFFCGRRTGRVSFVTVTGVCSRGDDLEAVCQWDKLIAGDAPAGLGAAADSRFPSSIPCTLASLSA